LHALFGPAWQQQHQPPHLERGGFDPLNFLTGEPIIRPRLVKIVRIVSIVDLILSLLSHNEMLEPILARMKSALVRQNTSLVACEQARVFFAYSSYISSFPGSKGGAGYLGPGEAFLITRMPLRADTQVAT
jgi:hypothetical protein